MRALGLVSIVALAACNTQRLETAPPIEPTLEIVREKDRDGNLVREQLVLVSRGERPLAHGADKGWYSNGAKRYEREFDRGSPSGPWRTWHANGQIASETTFAATEMLLSFWYDTGVISAAGPALNGSRRGVWRFFRPDGSVREEGTYVDSVRDGEWTFFEENGSKTSRFYARGVVVERQ
ncbi:MAG: hypothetical protein SGI72_05350 [Planctomycetota bacterium]|nr:hypothetical protein [Planctomycetota bacterium]